MATFVNVNDLNLDLYGDLIRFFRELKITLGPSGVNATLRHHPKIKQFLIDYQKSYLKSIEEKMTLDD